MSGWAGPLAGALGVSPLHPVKGVADGLDVGPLAGALGVNAIKIRRIYAHPYELESVVLSVLLHLF